MAPTACVQRCAPMAWTGSVDLPTRPLPVDVADGPIDLVAVQADDELVNALGSGAAVTYGDRAPEVRPRPPPPSRRASRRDAGGLARRDRGRADPRAGRPRHRRGGRRRRDEGGRSREHGAGGPTGCATSLRWPRPRPSSWRRSAVSGWARRTRCPATRCGRSRRSSIPSAPSRWRPRSRSRAGCRTCVWRWPRGDTVTAARELEAIRTEIPAVRGEEGQPQLLQEQEFLAAKLAETPPGTPADLTHTAEEQSGRPLDHGPGRAATAGVRAHRSVAAGGRAGRPVGVAAGGSGPAYPQRGAGSGARVGVGFGGADGSRLGLVRAGGHQGAHRVGAGEHGGRRGRDHRARPVRCDQPASEGGASRAGVGRCAGRGHAARTPRPPVPRARASTPRGRRPPAELADGSGPLPSGRGPLRVRGWRSQPSESTASA